MALDISASLLVAARAMAGVPKQKAPPWKNTKI
jgi:hypothetical protein